MVRIKHRYLLVNVLYPKNDDHIKSSNTIQDLPWTVKFRQPTADTVTSKQIITLIRKNVQEMFGDYGSGMIGGSLQIKYFSPATSTAIIRVGRAHYRMVWSALTFAGHISAKQPCVFQVVRVSGTIRKSEEEAIRRARASILRAKTSNSPSQPPAPSRQDDDMSIGIEDSDEAENVDDSD